MTSTTVVWRDEVSFRPEWQLGRDIHIIGCGALGSRYAVNLARARAGRLHLWDFDVVEAHNCRNQAYTPGHVGMRKVDALAAIIEELRPGENVVTTHPVAAVPGEYDFSGIVLFGTDSFKSRFDLMKALSGSEKVAFIGDGRMGASFGRAYGMCPAISSHMEVLFGKHLEENVSKDEPPLVCAATPPVAATADIVASTVLWQLGKWLHFEQGCDEPYHNFVFLGFSPPYMELEVWE